MKRTLAIVLGLAAIAIALVVWRSRGDSVEDTRSSTVPSATSTSAAAKRVDPRMQKRGSIAGTVRDETKAPIAGATVCADIDDAEFPSALRREPRCAVTDARGSYLLRDLLATRYNVVAGAPRYRVDRQASRLSLGAGQALTSIDFTLQPGGVEITGTVSDISGGPIAHARIRAAASWGRAGTPVVESGADGAFSIWISSGYVRVTADADGYASEMETTIAPSSIAFSLTPESTLSGVVVDARTGAPIEDALVDASATEWRWNNSHTDRTDAEGKFRLTRLAPSRYELTATIAHGYGRTEGSTILGLGQSVDGVVIKVFPAAQIVGRAMIAGAVPRLCTESSAVFKDEATGKRVGTRTNPDGMIVADGVPPGTYFPEVWCTEHRSRAPYPAISIAQADVLNQQWLFDAGFTIRGRVLSVRGEPIAGARVSTYWASPAESSFDGTYELRGVSAGSQRMTVGSSEGFGPEDGFEITVAGNMDHHDLVLEDGGIIEGSIADANGSPIVGVNVYAQRDGSRDEVSSDARGAFRIPGLRPADYLVSARRGDAEELTKAGAADGAAVGESVTVRVGQTAKVRLVVASQEAVIKGTVVDPMGRPVADAFVTSARETYGQALPSKTREHFQDDGKAILTGADGSFTINRLLPGLYTLRAFRRGGGEGIAEHVPSGSTRKVAIQQPGAIEGVAKIVSGGVPENLLVAIENAESGLERTEAFYRTDGRFVLRDLPAGRILITASANGGRKIQEVVLAAGETRSGVVIELDGFVTLTGRIVDAFTREPVANMQMSATPTPSSRSAWRLGLGPDSRGSYTDAQGRFSLGGTPRGRVHLSGMHQSWAYGLVDTERTLDGTGVVDVGDIIAVKRRGIDGEPYGYLGLEFAPLPGGRYSAAYRYEIRSIDPTGPAAKTELQIGDVVTAVDGVDITGDNVGYAETLLFGVAGTRLVFTLARGATATIVLGPQPKP